VGSPTTAATTGEASLVCGESPALSVISPGLPPLDTTEGVFVGDVVDAIGVGKFHYLLTFVVALACAAEAMEIFLLTFIREDVMKTFHVTDTQFAGLTTVVFLGMLCGAFAFGAMADFVGRRPACLISVALAAGGGFITCLATNFTTMIVFRFLVGIGVGGGHVPWSYLLEVIPRKNRETFVAWAQSAWTIGVLGQTALAYLLRDMGWRWLVIATAIPLCVCALLCFIIPESPRFLLSKGKHDAACKVFRRIIRVNDPTLKIRQRRPSAPFSPPTSELPGQYHSPGSALIDLDRERERERERERGRTAHTPTAATTPTLRTVSSPIPSTGKTEKQQAELPEDGFDEDVIDAVRSIAGGEKVLLLREPKNGGEASPVTKNNAAIRTEISKAHLDPDPTDLNPTGLIQKCCFILSAKSLRRLNLSLWLLWASVANAYYGVIMLTTSAMLQKNAYLNVFIASLGELPAYPLLGWSTRVLGRQKPSQGLPLIAIAGLLIYTFLPWVADVDGNAFFKYFWLFDVLVIRLCLLLQFDIVFLYSPECYPTTIRTTATGICSVAARISSSVAPFLAYAFVGPSAAWAPTIIFCAILYMGFVAASFVPFETKGVDMDDDNYRRGKTKV
jgi:MFS family permease